ncbi:hypothetical protein ACFLTE_06085 [Bacteroidota bacterium]
MNTQITSTLSYSFDNLKSKIINSILSVMIVIATPLVFASVSRYVVTGWRMV